MILKTERLVLREFTLDDAEFILELLNEQSFLNNIGDRNVRSLDDAREYLLGGPIASYKQNGFGLYAVTQNQGDAPIGMCGILRRDTLEDVDLGFAFLPKFWGQGYAIESAGAVLYYGKHALSLQRIVAITAPNNDASIRVLQKIGMVLEKMVKVGEAEAELMLFVS